MSKSIHHRKGLSLKLDILRVVDMIHILDSEAASFPKSESISSHLGMEAHEGGAMWAWQER